MTVNKLTYPAKQNAVQQKINEIIDNLGGSTGANTDLSNLTATGEAHFQAPLVSGTNIKTINNNSILGSGNLDIDTLPSQTGHAGEFVTTDGTDASWGVVPTATTSNLGLVKPDNSTIGIDANGKISSPYNAYLPNFANSVSKSTSGFTADADGWIKVFWYSSANSYCILNVNDNSVFDYNRGSGSHRITFWWYVENGDVVAFPYLAPFSVVFYYVKGVN